MKGRLMSATEVCVILDCSIYTLNNWYAYKRKNPDSEYAKMLPECVNREEGARTKRYWKQSDIEKLLKFKAAIPHGRNGILGSVTQKYAKKKGRVKASGKKVDKKSRSRAQAVCE